MVLSHSINYENTARWKENDPQLFGGITAQSVSNLYIEKLERERIICMAVTAKDYMYLDGRPSSSSAAIDDLIHGTMDKFKKFL